MWKSLGLLLTVSLHRQAVGQVLFDPSFARCHPNQSNPCIDPTQLCPYSVRSATERASLSICPDKLPLTGMKRCDKRQRTIQRTDGVTGVRNGQCKDPDEPACVATGENSESGMTSDEYADLKICEDKSNSAKRCDLAQRERCLHPTQDCTAHLHRRNDDNDADLTVCSDLVTTGVARCAASQAFPCIDPTVTCTAAINPNFASLAICNDKRDAGDTSRCDYRQVNPCIDPNSECPYADANLARRVTLSICPEKVPRPNVNRCHTSNNPADGPDNRCIDPRQGFECTEASSGLSTEEFTNYMGTNPKFCEDLAHRDLRCKARQFRPCIDPSQDCWESNASTLSICTELTPTAGINRCSAQQAHPCIDPRSGQECTSALNPSFADLSICNDLKSQGGVTRCDLRQLVPCYDPLTECPYSVVAKDNPRRRTLPVCLDKAELRRNAIPCHNDNRANNPADAAEARCIHDTTICVKTNFANLGYDDADAAEAALGNMNYCSEISHTKDRCDAKQISSCIHPLEDCFTHNRNGLTRCPDAPVSTGVKRCNQAVAPCINPADNIADCTGDVSSLRICADLAHSSARCDSRQLAPCFDPLADCPYEHANRAFRLTLNVCPDRAALRRNDIPCHNDNRAGNPTDAAEVRCIHDTTVCVKTNHADLGYDDADAAEAALNNMNYCSEISHTKDRCDAKQIASCIHPLEDCFDHTRTGLTRCPDAPVSTGVLRCNQAVAPCINPAENIADCTGDVSDLKICADVADTVPRCDSRHIAPCFDPVAPCPYSATTNQAFRTTISICPDRADARRNDIPCHNENRADAPNGGDPEVRCIHDLTVCRASNHVALGYDDADAAEAALGNMKFCQEIAHTHNRCLEQQRDACLHPLQDCFHLGEARPADLCGDVTPTTGVLRCNQSVNACINPTESLSLCTRPLDSLFICSDLALTKNRCNARQISPCIDPTVSTTGTKGSPDDIAKDCPFSENADPSSLKICANMVENAQTMRCDSRQQAPCIDPMQKCPYLTPGRASLQTCADKVALRRGNGVAIPCHNDNRADAPNAGAAEVRCIHDTEVCVRGNEDLGYDNAEAAGTALDEMNFCEENTLTETAAMSRCFTKNLNAACFSRNFPIARANDGTEGVTACYEAGDASNFCPEQELTCSPQVTTKCLNADEDFCPNLTFRPPLCTHESWTAVTGYPARQDPNVIAGQKRCRNQGDERQPYPCIDPTESVCEATENPNPGDLKICADRAYLVNRCDRRNHSPCIDPTIECPTSTATPTPLAVCPDLVHADTTIPRCSVRQPFNKACIDPASPCNASLNPAWQTLKVCEDLASGFNRCDPLQRTPCINPAQPCPFGIDITGLSICADLSVNSSLNRCHTSQNAPCLNPATPCQVADNPAPSTLSICADLARNYNRCHPNQQVPCKDPTAPCTTAINPNYSTLPVCADLVSSAPSTLPSSIPSNLPSLSPSTLPSNLPSLSPSDIPSGQPSLSINPSAAPSAAPSASPSASPSLSANPSAAPSASPSAMPSALPSVHPSESPSVSPSSSPSMSPSSSKIPSSTPSFRPTVSVRPTFKGQTYEPSDAPSSMPSSSPSVAPSAPPSIAPSGSPSASPSDRPSASPSTSPSSSPSVSPSGSPSSSPSVSPSSTPTLPGGPSAAPSVNCVDDPDFLLDANENRNCEWARENPDRVDIRCAKVDSVTNVAVADACPLSCNPECEEFVPTPTPKTSEPTISPETQCGEDDPDFLFQNREGRNCEWVASRPTLTEKRCDKKDTDGELVSTKCTFTCQLRCVCKNSKKKFRLNGEKVKCKDVGRNQCDQGVRFRGRNTFVKERCPRKCNYCFDL